MERSYPRLTSALINWHARRGRHDLPWQKERSLYRVWISEIMLQQTQVITVIPYYERFIARFPDVQSLAAAGIDEVLHLWTGLGYYARARNLHRAAQRICADFGGQLPSGFDALVSLPGIGRSTAGAILALSCGAPFPILDGNAKRVLARFFGVTGAPNDTVLTKRLWQLAERCTPRENVAVYTQAIMDLGATVCVRRKPLCDLCPLGKWCSARASGRAARNSGAPSERCAATPQGVHAGRAPRGPLRTARAQARKQVSGVGFGVCLSSIHYRLRRSSQINRCSVHE